MEGAALSNVLGDDDLLAEILLRAGFPTALIRAAAICRRWLHHVSDPAFLLRFRKLNPPRLLGFYIQRIPGHPRFQRFQGHPRFVTLLPQHPELVAATARVVRGYSFGADDDIKDSRNGSVFTVPRGGDGVSQLGVHSPLRPGRAMAIDPPLLPPPSPAVPTSFLILSREEKSGPSSYFYMLMEFRLDMRVESTDTTVNLTARVYTLQDGVWCAHTSATTHIPHQRAGIRARLVDDKIYMTLTLIDITILDLTTSTFSTIQLPEPVKDIMISRADDTCGSGVYLIALKELQLGIWLYKGGSWSTVDTICLHAMCANLIMSDHRFEDADTSFLRLKHVGDNAEFVLLDMGRCVVYLDMRCKTLRTLYEMSQYDQFMGISIHPFMMIWPPTFPALKCDPTRNAT